MLAGSSSGRFVDSSVEIKPVLFGLLRPSPLDLFDRYFRRNLETTKRQNRSPNRHSGLSCSGAYATIRAGKHRRADVSVGSDTMQHLIQTARQRDQLSRRNSISPLASECGNHLRKPRALSIPRWHLANLNPIILSSASKARGLNQCLESGL